MPLHEAAALLAREVLAGRIKIEAWDEAVEQWIIRVNRLAEWFPGTGGQSRSRRPTGPPSSSRSATARLGARAVRDKPVMPILRDWLTAEQLAALDDCLPERLTMANGRRSRLTYAEGRAARS